MIFSNWLIIIFLGIAYGMLMYKLGYIVGWLKGYDESKSFYNDLSVEFSKYLNKGELDKKQ